MTTQTLTSPTGQTLAPTWASLGVRRGFDPGPAWKRRVFITGFPSTGKSTFVSSIPDAIVLDFEDSSRDVPNPTAYRYGPYTKDDSIISPTLEQYDAIMDKLVAEGRSPNRQFNIVVWDTIDEYINLVSLAFCKEKGVATVGDYRDKGAGWAAVHERVFKRYSALLDAGYGVWIVGHLRRKTQRIGKEDQDVVSPAISDSFRTTLFRRVQYIFYTLLTKTQRTAIKKVSLSDGSTKEITTNLPKWDVSYALTVATPNNPEDGMAKARIPIDETIPVGQTDGYAAYLEAYDRAVRTIKDSLTSNKGEQ